MKKNAVQWVLQCMGWQARKRPVGFRLRVQALTSVVKAPDEGWSMDRARFGQGVIAGPVWPW